MGGEEGGTDPPPVFRFGKPSSPEEPRAAAAAAVGGGSPFVFGAVAAPAEGPRSARPVGAAKPHSEAPGSDGSGSVPPTVVRQTRKFRRSRVEPAAAGKPGSDASGAEATAGTTDGEEPLHYIDEFTNELKGGAPGRLVGAPELFGSPPPQQRERVIRRFKRPTSVSSGSPSKDIVGQLTAQAVAQALLLKQAGNKLHAEKKFLQASIQYQDALSLLPGAGSQPPGGKDSAAATWVSCQLNMVACQLAQSEWSAAALRSSQILECTAVAPDDVHSRMKAHYRRARARMELGLLDPAWEDLQAAIHLSPSDPALQGLKADLVKKRAALASAKPPNPAPVVSGGVSVADAIAAKQSTFQPDPRANGQSALAGTATQVSAAGPDAGLSADVLKRLTLDSPEQFGQILELAVLRKMQRLGLHEMINIMTTDEMVPGGLPVALAEARGELRESVADEYKAFVFSFMQIEMQLLPGTQLEPTAARVRVNEVVDGLNQLAERLAAGEAFDMSSYDVAVVEGFKTLVRTGPAMTRLHCATSRGSTNEVRYMLKSGVDCDLEATTESGYTPLVVAILEGQFEVCQMLIEEFGADVNSTGPCGQSLMHYACATVNPDEQLTLVRLLVEGGADVNARDANGVTCLHLACMGLNKPLTQLFIAHGADVHTRSNDGVTPQQAADRWGAPPRGIKSFKSFFQLCVKKSKRAKDRAAMKSQPLPDPDGGHNGGRRNGSHATGFHGRNSVSVGGPAGGRGSLSPPKMQTVSDDVEDPCGAAEAADAMAAELIKEEAQKKAEAQKRAEKKKKQKQRKQQEKQKKAEEERRVKEEADKLRQEEERAKQAAVQEAQRLKREKKQVAQRERQAALRGEQEARARARLASERAEAAAKTKAMAKAEKANKALRAKENRDKERDTKEKKTACSSSGSDVELSIHEPGFGSECASLDEKATQRVASSAASGFGNVVSSPRGNVEEEAASPTCPSTPLAGLSSLPLPPSMTTPPIGLQAASSSSPLSAATIGGTSSAKPIGSDLGNAARSAGSSTTWSPKDLHCESMADSEGPLARLVIVGDGNATGQDSALGRLERISETADDVLRDLLDEVDSTEVNFIDKSHGSSAGSAANAHSSAHRNGGWGSPERQIGSPRLEHAIGSMWDDADPVPAPAPSREPSHGAVRAPRNAMETAAAWPTVPLESTTGRQAQRSGNGSSQSQSQSARGSLPGVSSSTAGQSHAVQSWATGRLVGSSSPNSPDGSNTGGRDLGEEELPDWLLSTLGEMGGDGINMPENAEELDEPSSPVAEYLSQKTPAGPRRSDLKLAGRCEHACAPRPALASMGEASSGNGDSGDGQARVQQSEGAVGVSSSTAGDRVNPAHSVHWAPPGAFPPAPTVAGNGSLAANGWAMAAVDKNGANDNHRGGGSGNQSKGWTVGTHRAKIV